MEDLGVGRRLLDDEDKEDEDDSGQDVFVRSPLRIGTPAAIDTLLPSQDSIQRRLVGPALEQANKAARTIVGFLLQRCGNSSRLL